MTSRQPKSEEGVLQPPRRTPFVYLVHENSMNMPTAILHPRTAAMVASPDQWPRHDAMWPAALALRKFLLEHTSMRARPRSNKL